GRGIGVVAEEPLGRNCLADLGERALRAEIELQRKTVLPLAQLLVGEQGVRERNASEVQHLQEIRMAAGSTTWSVVRVCTHRAHHRFQGGAPDNHSRSSPCLSRNVSMHCQKPSCLYPASCPSPVSLSKRSTSSRSSSLCK